MKKTICLFLFLAICSACTMAVRESPYQWPQTVTFMEGEGDIDLSWKGRRFSGSFALTLNEPSFLFEVYGPFGQTLLHLDREGDRVKILTGDGASHDERFFAEQYGMGVDDFIEDLTMKGSAGETPEGRVIDRDGYRVLYTSDKNRPRICWSGPDGSICLTFSALELNGGGR